MKNLFKLSLFTVLVSCFVSVAQAGLLIEPVVGYNLNAKGDAEKNDKLTNDVSYSGGSGTSYGGRLGYQNLGFQLGLDYLHSNLTIDKKGLEDSVSSSEWAAFAGFEFPILVRVYAGYIFSATGNAETDDGKKIALSEGSGTKIGVGFTGLPFIDINVEYRTGSFGELKYGDTKTGAKTDFSALLLSLSAPFVL